LKTLSWKIDGLLESWKLSDKNRYMILTLKLNIAKFFVQ
jgi:hypothetical protein